MAKIKIRKVIIGKKELGKYGFDVPLFRYTKKPVQIWATQISEPFEVYTLEGIMKGNAGDWLIRGVEGDFYPCKDSIFKKTYN
jgi:hypothetical protein